LQDQVFYYLSHQTRKVYLNAKSARETKNAFFGKKGWTLHLTLIYTRKSDHQLNIQAYDHWSADSYQDAASLLHAVIESLETKPEWITFLSDNGPHYHNADQFFWIRFHMQ